MRCANMNYLSRQRFDEISKLRFDGNLSAAIERCHDAISAYPEDNFFYKVLGDLYFQEKDYVAAPQAYLEHLKRLSKKPEHFKAFARFYKQFTSEAPGDLCVHFRAKITKAIEDGEIAPGIHQLLMETFGDAFVIDDHFKTILCKSDSDRHLAEIKRFIETASANEVRSVIFYQIHQENYCANTKTREYLISVAEKKFLYSEAQQLVGKIIAKQESPNPTLIRTLLRMSRKQRDYHFAEQLLTIDERLVKKSDFNIQYELVYYFDSTGNSELLGKTLKKMRNSAERSIPIAKTLYNFYLTFDRFEDAQLLSEHIQKLIDRKHVEKKRDQQLDRNEEQLESEQIVWQRVKDLARGSQESISKCNCQISPEGHICQNNRYTAPRKKWNKKRIKAWLQLINHIFEGKSELLTVDIEPFDSKTVAEAKNVITHALIHNFASMDAMIAATAKLACDNYRDVTVITSDKGLKACLSKIDIPCNDVFATN